MMGSAMAMGLLSGAAVVLGRLLLLLLFPLAAPGLAMFPPLLPMKELVLPVGRSSTRGPGMRFPRVVMLISEGSVRKSRAMVAVGLRLGLGTR